MQQRRGQRQPRQQIQNHNNHRNKRNNNQNKPAWPTPFPRPDESTPQPSNNRRYGHGNGRPRDIPHGDNTMPICLDYLKGVCASKRWTCKYAHPPLWLVPKGPASERHICTVYVLTGHCKYGDRCFGLHPPLHDPVCKPAYLSKEMLRHEDEHPCEHLHDNDTHSFHGSESAISDETSSEGTKSRGPTPPPRRHSGAGLPACGVKTVIGLLNRLTPQKFDNTLREIFVLLSSGEVSMEQVLPIIFGKAVREPLLCSLYAQLCKHLHDLVPRQQQPAVFTQLTETANTLLYQEFETKVDENFRDIKSNLLGACSFVGELYMVGLFSKAQMNTKLEYLIKTANDGHSEVALEMACSLLAYIGYKLEREDPANLNRFFHIFEHHKTEHPVRSQCLIDNLFATRAKGWERK